MSETNAITLHENITLLEVDRPEQMDELELLPEVRHALVRRLDPCTAVLDAARLPALLAALEKHGHLPRVTGPDED